MFYLITGHYGSGKTEVAINLALRNKVQSIVDLDIVNPYFRTKDAEEKLTQAGIRLVAPQFANTNLDLPTLPPEIFSVLQSSQDAVFDIGGDDDGAVALGQYRQYFSSVPYQNYMVVNTKRPLTSTAEEILAYKKAIEATSRLAITGLINNTNLKEDTTPEMIERGLAIVRQAAEAAHLPVIYTAAAKEFCGQIKTDTEVLPLELHLTLPWETNKGR